MGGGLVLVRRQGRAGAASLRASLRRGPSRGALASPSANARAPGRQQSLTRRSHAEIGPSLAAGSVPALRQGACLCLRRSAENELLGCTAEFDQWSTTPKSLAAGSCARISHWDYSSPCRGSVVRLGLSQARSASCHGSFRSGAPIRSSKSPTRVFSYARPEAGGGVPLAVARRAAKGRVP